MISGYREITRNPATYPKALKMGYPPYSITWLGIAKFCAVCALDLPNARTLKEWVSAGFTSDVLFAFVSGIAIGSPADGISSFTAFVLIMTTYRLSRRTALPAAAGSMGRPESPPERVN